MKRNKIMKKLYEKFKNSESYYNKVLPKLKNGETTEEEVFELFKKESKQFIKNMVKRKKIK